MKNNKFVCFVLIPTFACLLLLRAGPIIIGLAISFMDYHPLNNHNDFIGLSNFVKLFSDDLVITAVQNTLVYVFVTVTINIFLTLLLAQFMQMLPKKRSKNLFRTVLFLPCIAPIAASSVVWNTMFNLRKGLLNMAVTGLGFAPIDWIGSGTYAMISIIIFTLWADLGYNIILVSAGLDAIPDDFHEAAELDGANGIKKFFFITLPLLGRTLLMVISMTIISYFQMIAQFTILTNGGPGTSTNVLSFIIHKTAFRYKQMGYASTISILLFALIMIVTLTQQRLSRVEWGY